MNCEWVKSNVTLYVYDELKDDERYELEQHLDRCSGCAGEVKSAQAFKAAMAALPQMEPTPNLLTSCRMQLQERLEETTQAQGWRRFVFDPMSWLHRAKFSPALAAVLLMVGFGAGAGTAYKIASSHRPVAGGGTVAQVETPSGPVEANIVGIRDITQQPGSNKVEIKYDTMIPQQAQGSLEDPAIQRLLLFAAHSQNNSGVRMDSVDLLTKKPDDENVREALMYALRYDTNPGVRLKALEGLGAFVQGDVRVRNAVLEALMNDGNPGVRTEAIQLLKPVRTDGSVRQVLQHLAAQDQNQNIRTLSRSVLASTPQVD
jgi:HEAT repeats/Putative zinc-finger